MQYYFKKKLNFFQLNYKYFIKKTLQKKRTETPGTELVKQFKLLDKVSVPRGKSSIIYMREALS